eukprot:CAMPEP_0174350020 /NCGR_PEP_ID=MMETSP0811_2-20130205/6947_1 /TAXON_ID=73025 ORGANISM="Eutreptiella gymnastica-like, Strain CCMP1594" /NCGR_SAMPLE_ID=MMETSP0811_2 /ASSEMBLY_ACC=CAM_ASM_000667 /LENGTH=46 /DNA_ID= /DNA_START= /DNA_END= /DNA_ORIENTATION=
MASQSGHRQFWHQRLKQLAKGLRPPTLSTPHISPACNLQFLPPGRP